MGSMAVSLKPRCRVTSENVWGGLRHAVAARPGKSHRYRRTSRGHRHRERWVTQKFGGFPKTGDTLSVGACELRVEEMDGPRVARLKITKSAVPVEQE